MIDTSSKINRIQMHDEYGNEDSEINRGEESVATTTKKDEAHHNKITNFDPDEDGF
jgi:hypothetical protein